jgi:poly(3-hydroxybutyrate) depolymerase
MIPSTQLRTMPVVLAAMLAGTITHAQDRPTDEWLANPVDQRTFEAYLEFFTYSSDLAFETDVVSTSEESGVREEHLRFQSTPGVVVTARLYHPTGVEVANAPAIVYLHGGGPSGKDRGATVRAHRFLARAGIAVLAIDMLHYGERDDGFFTTFDEMEKHERLYNNDAVYLEWVQQTVKEVSRSFDFLVAERGADPARIGLAGISRGGVLATIAGGADRRFAAVALLHAGHFDFFEDGHRAAACPANYIGRISPRPLFLLNAENDADFVPDAAIRPLHRLAGEPATHRWTNRGHGFMGEDDMSALAAWLRENLP